MSYRIGWPAKLLGITPFSNYTLYADQQCYTARKSLQLTLRARLQTSLKVTRTAHDRRHSQTTCEVPSCSFYNVHFPFLLHATSDASSWPVVSPWWVAGCARVRGVASRLSCFKRSRCLLSGGVFAFEGHVCGCSCSFYSLLFFLLH